MHGFVDFVMNLRHASSDQLHHIHLMHGACTDFNHLQSQAVFARVLPLRGIAQPGERLGQIEGRGPRQTQRLRQFAKSQSLGMRAQQFQHIQPTLQRSIGDFSHDDSSGVHICEQCSQF